MVIRTPIRKDPRADSTRYTRTAARSYGSLLLYKMGGTLLRLSILGGVTYVLVVARTGSPTVPTALGVPYGYAPAVTRVLGPTIAMSVTILKL